MSVEIAETRWGRQLYLDTDIYIGRSIPKYGEYCWLEIEALAPLLKPGNIVVDAGAHIGTHSLPLGQIVGPTGIVHAFEPHPPINRLLCGTIGLNETWQVIPYQFGLGAGPGLARMDCVDYKTPNNFGGLSLDLDPGPNSQGYPVTVAPLDMFKLDRLALLKADVEGMESEVIIGAKETITRCQPVLYLECDRYDRAERLIGLVRDLEYDIFSHVVPYYTPVNYRGDPEDIWPGLAAFNLLCLPHDSEFGVGLPRVLSIEDLPKAEKHKWQ